MERTTCFLMRRCFYVLDQHAEFDFYSARSLKQQCTGRQTYYSISNRIHYPDSEPIT